MKNTVPWKRYPAKHYVLVDDKLRILTAVKRIWGRRLTTVFPRQGHYAHDRKALASYPPADITIERIGDLLRYDVPSLIAAVVRAALTHVRFWRWTRVRAPTANGSTPS